MGCEEATVGTAALSCGVAGHAGAGRDLAVTVGDGRLALDSSFRRSSEWRGLLVVLVRFWERL